MSQQTYSFLARTLDHAIEAIVALLFVVTVGAPLALLAFGWSVGAIGW
jgi:ABC-type proline/glycine betaine transport system permease subunit